jgi:hypothetical protein
VLVLVFALALAPPLTFKDLQAFTFFLGETSSVAGGKVPLSDGKWTDPEGGSSFVLLPLHAIGDLNGDGSADAAAILVESSGGTGSFYYLFAIMNRDGKPVQIGEPEWLGDRTIVQRLTIDRKGIIAIRMITHKDDDPSCCPTLKIDDRYRVDAGKLIGITK